jgi:peroxiredoxin
LRDQRDEIQAAGADIVAIGTGDRAYAERFVDDTGITFRVLLDDDARAARAATVTTTSWFGLLHPRTWRATRATSKRGYHVHKAGTRVKQLGATFVLGAGDRVRYEHIDTDSTDHAPVDEVVAALRDT